MRMIALMLGALVVVSAWAKPEDWYVPKSKTTESTASLKYKWKSPKGRVTVDIFLTKDNSGNYVFTNDIIKMLTDDGYTTYDIEAMQMTLAAMNGVKTIASNLDSLKVNFFTQNGNNYEWYGEILPAEKYNQEAEAGRGGNSFPVHDCNVSHAGGEYTFFRDGEAVAHWTSGSTESYTLSGSGTTVNLTKSDGTTGTPAGSHVIPVPEYTIENGSGPSVSMKKDGTQIGAWNKYSIVEQVGTGSYTFYDGNTPTATWTSGGGGSVAVDDITIGRDGAQKLTIKNFGANNCNETMAGMLESGDTSHKILAAKKDGETNVLHYVSMGQLNANKYLRTFTFKNQNGVYGTLSRGEGGENDPIIGITDVGLVDVTRPTTEGRLYFLSKVSGGALDYDSFGADEVGTLLEGLERDLHITVDRARNADFADSSNFATNANVATTATNAKNAEYADTANSASNALQCAYASSANQIVGTDTEGAITSIIASGDQNVLTVYGELDVVGYIPQGDGEGEVAAKIVVGEKEGTNVEITGEGVQIGDINLTSSSSQPTIAVSTEGSCVAMYPLGIAVTNATISIVGESGKLMLDGTNITEIVDTKIAAAIGNVNALLEVALGGNND